MKTVTTSVGFQSPDGTILANGSLVLNLAGGIYEILASGGQVYGGQKILPLDANGKITNTSIWASDELNGTPVYNVTLRDSSLANVGSATWLIIGGSPIDLSTMINLGTGGSVSVPGVVFTNPAGNQSIANGNLSLAGNFTPDANATRSLGSSSKGWKDIIAAGTPWVDVRSFGLIDDGITDNTPAFNTMIAAMVTSKAHIVYFPITATGNYVFNSAPNPIGAEIILVGNYNQWNGFGTGTAALVANYTEGTAINGFISFTGSTSPGNSGVRGLLLWKGVGKTGGVAIKYSGTGITARAGGGPIEDVRISGDGTWNYGLYIDGTNIATAGTQGIRDVSVRNFDVFQTTTKAVWIANVVHFKWVHGGCFPTAASAAVTVTGSAAANTQSTNVEFTAVEILDTLTLDFVTNFVGAGCYCTNLTATANATLSYFSGISINAPSISGQLAYVSFDPNSPAGYGTALTNSLRATNFIATGTVPSNIGTGDIAASSGTTSGNYKIGSDGNCIIRRNNGSGSGTNLAFTFDAFGTTPLQFDTSTGMLNTKDDRSRRFRANQGTAYSGADAAIVLSSGWGTTRTVSAATGFDQGFSFTANSSGTGQAANPTITITFKDGTWTTAPIIQILRNDLITPFNTPPHTWVVTATTLTITFNGTPTAGNSYSFVVMEMGT